MSLFYFQAIELKSCFLSVFFVRKKNHADKLSFDFIKNFIQISAFCLSGQFKTSIHQRKSSMQSKKQKQKN